MEKRWNTNRTKPELLIPAKDLEVLRTAVNFGADAVYIGGEAFSLRAKARNFSPEDMREGIVYAHARGVHVHVAANIYAHNYDLDQAAEYFELLKEIRPDAILVADPGMFALAREHCPHIPIHISTQANNTNYETFKFWHRMGASRVVCARELSLREIAMIRERTPANLEIEAFIHGAMCISYSGRCLLSSWFTGRDANHGACTHPCRWKYAVAEESRPGEYLPIEENDRGTFIFNSRDLCMIGHIPELAKAGIDSLKIEGRMKTALYVASITRAYRHAIDDYLESDEKYAIGMEWYMREIRKCTYRDFTTGFYFGKPDKLSMVYTDNTYSNDAVFLGIIEDSQPMSAISGLSESRPSDSFGHSRSLNGISGLSESRPSDSFGHSRSLNGISGLPDSRPSDPFGHSRSLNGISGLRELKPIQNLSAFAASSLESDSKTDGHSFVTFRQKNKFAVGDVIEIMKPDGTDLQTRVLGMWNPEGIPVRDAPHPGELIRMELDAAAAPGDILRTEK